MATVVTKVLVLTKMQARGSVKTFYCCVTGSYFSTDPRRGEGKFHEFERKAATWINHLINLQQSISRGLEAVKEIAEPES